MRTPDESVLAKVASEVEDLDFVRKRRSPAPGDPHYLILADLLAALERFASNEKIAILDFGCGGSPYRSLFPEATYIRADVSPVKGRDVEIRPDGTTGRCDAEFDMVLSTQVLEHVEDTHAYLLEAFRVLRPGGRLLLTTHGSFYDHASPHDFRRWTRDGLCADVRRAGFQIEESLKLTTNGRAIAYLVRKYSRALRRPRRRIWGLASYCIGIAMDRWAASFDRWCDAVMEHERFIEGTTPGHDIYIGLLVHSRKPATLPEGREKTRY